MSPETVVSRPARGMPGSLPVAAGLPPLPVVADLLAWKPVPYHPLEWRGAFDVALEREVHQALALSESEDCIAQSLLLLSENSRRRFLRAPVIAAMLRRHVGNQFNGRVFANFLLAELAAAGVVSQLRESLWTARGDRFLDAERPEDLPPPGPTLRGISLDSNSPFHFPDDEFGLPSTVPHDPAEYAFAVRKVTQGLDALADVSPCALELVVSLIEVLALRREEPESPDFYSSTFPGCPGLVRFTNTHRDETDLYELIEGLVHESIHCLLHVYEEIQGPFVRKQDDSHRRVQSPWSGTTIRLQSYVHACAVWYGLYWLWSHHDFAAGPWADRVAVMRQRAGFGFQFRPVSVVLAAYRPLLSNEVWPFLLELEDRMLPYLEKGSPAWLPR